MDKEQQKEIQHWLKQQARLGGRWQKLAVALGVFNGLLLVLQAGFLAHILSAIIISHQEKERLIPQFAALLVLFLIRGLCSWGREICGFRAAHLIRHTIRSQMLDRLVKLGPAFIHTRSVGSWSSMLLEQIEQMHDFYARYLPQTRIAIYLPLIILAVVFPINWASGLLLLITAPLIPLFMILIGMGAADANRRNFAALSRLSAHFLDRLKGFRTLKLFHRQQAEQEAIEQACESFRQRTMEVLRLAFLNSAVLEFFTSVSIALVAVYFGFNYLGFFHFGGYDAKVSLLAGLFVLFLAPEYFLPLRELGAQYHAKAQAIGAAQTLYEFLHQQVNPPPQGTEPFPLTRTIAIEAVDLEVLSAEGVRLLGPVSFNISPSQRIAIVGHSGAGKTSLLNCLLGFMPYRGSLRINGIELNALSPQSWREQIGWLGQNPQLFCGTIRNNLILGPTHLSDDSLYAALAKAQALDFVNEKLGGLDFIVGEQHHGLSVGQAQRLALARMLLRPCGLLLLDEPTASLDRHNEQLVNQALQQHLGGRTLLMVTHRIEQLEHMDRILVFAQGQLVEQGSFSALSQSKGVFHSMLEQRDGRSLDE